MRRFIARMFVVGPLGFGCARPTPSVPPPEPEAAPVAVAPRAGPQLEVREVPPAAFADPKRRQKIEALLPGIREEVAKIVAEENLVGLAIGVVVDGELVLGEGFGVRHSEQGGAIDTRTAFRIGSITKVFTGMTALRLWEEGRLDLDAPAATALPELNTLAYPTADARPMTVRDILTHTAGLPRDPDLPVRAPGEVYTRDQLMQSIDGLSLVRAPGVAYEYSNLGFALLGHIIAAATGKRFGAAIREAILDPLAMTNTVWEPKEVPPERLALGHLVVDGRVVVRPPGGHSALSAAGGLFSTVEDLARFIAFQLDAWPPRSSDDDGPLTRATLREAQRLRAFRSFRARTAPPELADAGVEGGASGVGFVWGVTHGCEHPHVVGHNGALDGYFATVRMLPLAGIGIIVLGNAAWADTDHIADVIQRALARGGTLARRAPQALPELTGAATRIIGLFGQWDPAKFAEWSTHGLGGAYAGGRLKKRMDWLYDALGTCTLGPLRRPTSPWSGVFLAQCERGKAELTLALTSARTPRISSVAVSWIDGTPTAPVQDAAAAAATLLEQFDEAKFRAIFSPGFTLADMRRIVASVQFEHGVCRLDRPLEVEGPEKATYALKCDRGSAKLSLGLDRGEPARIVSFDVVTTGALPVCR